MADCEILGDDGKPADIKTGDIVTSNGGILGLGHAGVIEVRGDDLIVLEVMAAPDGSVHVQERNLCDFLNDYDAQNREVFISRPRNPNGEPAPDWSKRLQRVVDYVKERVCNRYPVWAFGLDVLFHLPDVWYCSDLVSEAFRREGIEFEIRLPIEESSDDAATREFLFLWKGEVLRRFGDVDGDRFLRGFELPEKWADVGAGEKPGLRPEEDFVFGSRFDSLESLVSEALWRKQVSRMAEVIESEFAQAASALQGG